VQTSKPSSKSSKWNSISINPIATKTLLPTTAKSKKSVVDGKLSSDSFFPCPFPGASRSIILDYFHLRLYLRNFHRPPRRSADSNRSSTRTTGYRGGTRKGLDLNLGGPVTSSYFAPSSAEKHLRGGILLRTLRRISDSKVISGPSLLVDEILRLSGAARIPDLVEHLWGGDTSAFPPASYGSKPSSVSLYLRPVTAPASVKSPIYRSPRIGLDLSHPGTTNSPTDPRIVFISKPYRYFVHPELLTSNGRSQTFLGVYRTCLASGRHDDSGLALRREMVRLTGMKEHSVIKYLADYQSGIDEGNLQSFIGASGKGASASPATYLKMMGALVRVHAPP